MYLMQRTELGDRFSVFTTGFLYRCISTKGIGIVGWCVGVLVISLGVLCLLDTPKGSVFLSNGDWKYPLILPITHVSSLCVCVCFTPRTLSLSPSPSRWCTSLRSVGLSFSTSHPLIVQSAPTGWPHSDKVCVCEVGIVDII